MKDIKQLNRIFNFYRTKPFLCIGIVYALVSGCTLGSSQQIKSYSANDIEIYECVGGKTERFTNRLNNIGVLSAYLINASQIVPKFNFTIEKELFENRVAYYLPNKYDYGMVVLNVEGHYIDSLGRSSDDAYVDKLINHYIEIVSFAKRFRPNATFGFYGLPFRQYWSRDEDWKKKNERLLPLLKEVDALFPSLYDFYADVTMKNGLNRDSEYVRENVLEYLRIGRLAGKPVFPFVWHRYHPSNKTLGMTFIPKEEFIDHIRTISKTDYMGSKVNGIVWWSSEKYYYNISEEGRINRRSTEKFDQIFNEQSYPYLDYLIKGVQSN